MSNEPPTRWRTVFDCNACHRIGLFQSSVTYICEHGEAGAMGIVINKPLDLQLADIFEHLNIQPLLSHDEVAVLAEAR